MISAGKYVIFLLLLWPAALRAQKEAYIWYFGNGAGISFHTSPPTALTDSKMFTTEGCTSIADSLGQLLFYTDGITIWDKTHNVMNNGSGLFGNSSSSQSGIVFKNSYNDSCYYVVTSDAIGGTSGVCYSIVDMRMNNKKGAVTSKNVKLLNTSSEKITAINHPNKKDVWLAAVEYGTDSVCIFRTTSTGLVLHSVFKTGKRFSGFSAGQAKFSIDGRYLALGSTQDNFATVLDFDAATGLLSNPRHITSTVGMLNGYGLYGLEFSPTAQYLYLTEFYRGFVSQCPVTDHDINIITDCKRIDSLGPNKPGQLQLGPDNKIYMSVYQTSFLSVINFPDQQGASCGFNYNAIPLGGKIGMVGLPSFYQGYFANMPNISIIDACQNDSASLAFGATDMSKVDSIHWYVGDTTVRYPLGSRVFSFKYPAILPATLVKAIAYCKDDLIITANATIKPKPYPVVNLGNDTTICKRDTIILKAAGTATSFRWQDGSNKNIYIAFAQQQYKVTGTLNGCSTSDSVQVYINNAPHFWLGSDTILCDPASITLSAHHSTGSYLWSTGDTTAQITVSTGGSYRLALADSGCTAYDTIKVTVNPLPAVELGNDTIICEGDTITLKPKGNATAYKWDDGSTGNTMKAFANRKYKVGAWLNGCVSMDSMNLYLGSKIKFSLGSDTAFCEGTSFTINPNYTATKYMWSDGSTKPDLTVKDTGVYWLVTSDSGCFGADSIRLSFKYLPAFELGNDTKICLGNKFQLKAAYPGATALWNDGSTDSVKVPVLTGMYSVTLTNACGSLADSVFITVDSCLCYAYLPDAFTPNNDFLNDIFQPSFDCQISEYRFLIFNRWGELVYETNNPAGSWDGNFREKPVPIGIYFFRLSYTYAELGQRRIENKAGIVHLER